METKICTTREQSERLLSLGLKKETADMKYVGLCRNEDGSIFFQKTPICKGVITENNIDLPAWSLHRIMSMVYSCRAKKNGLRLAIIGYDNPFEDMIQQIEWLIKEGYFNKEYLE